MTDERGTEYLVLRASNENQGDGPPRILYEIIGQTKAAGARPAVRALVPQPEERTEYVAVPERNWTSLSPKIKQRDPIVEWTETKTKRPASRPGGAAA